MCFVIQDQFCGPRSMMKPLQVKLKEAGNGDC